jgi:hypothetical protein
MYLARGDLALEEEGDPHGNLFMIQLNGGRCLFVTVFFTYLEDLSRSSLPKQQRLIYTFPDSSSIKVASSRC